MEELISIPWGKVFANFVWIFGASIILADFSYHEFLSHQKRVSFGSVLNGRSFKWPFQLGLILIAIGVSLSIKNPWLTGIFVGAAFLQIIFLIRSASILKKNIDLFLPKR